MTLCTQNTPVEYTEYPCDICNCADAVEVPYARFYTNDQPIHICKGCGFVYVRNRRSAEAIARTWSNDLYKGHYETTIPAVKCRHVYFADFINNTLGLAGKQVYDIGAGTGQFLSILRDQYQARCFGIEPSAENCQTLAKKGFDYFNGTIEQYSSEVTQASSADIATIVFTLENCCSCRTMLENANEILTPGGHLVVATGSRILVPFKKPLFDYLNATPADTNSFRFSAGTLTRLLHSCGFTVTQVNRYLDTDYLCIIAQKQTPTGDTPPGDNFMAVHHFFERWHLDTMHYMGTHHR